MASVDATALRCFLDPVRDAEKARAEALADLSKASGSDVKTLRAIKKRSQAAAKVASAQRAYDEAVGELIGGVQQLVDDAESQVASGKHQVD